MRRRECDGEAGESDDGKAELMRTARTCRTDPNATPSNNNKAEASAKRKWQSVQAKKAFAIAQKYAASCCCFHMVSISSCMHLLS